MKTTLKLFGYGLLLLSSLTISIAQSANRIKGNRKIEIQERKIESFSKLHVSMGITAEITNDPAGTVEVEAENNVMPYVKTFVERDTLFITIVKDQPLNDITPVVVRLEINRLTGFLVDVGGLVKVRKPINETSLIGTLASGGEIRADVTSSTLHLTLRSGSKASLTGRSDNAVLSLSGGSRLMAEDLRVSQCEIVLRGGCEAVLHIDKSLSATANGESRLLYTGNPVVTSAQTSGASTITNSKR